jgi:sarcosine oxidase delta subunit
MQDIRCPNCNEDFRADIQGTWNAGETTVLRGKDQEEASAKPDTLRQTKRVNVICPYCEFEFVVPVEDQNAN